MKCIGEILEASAHINDAKLEPTDNTLYLITIRNRSHTYTANNVTATIYLVGGPVDGITITPDDRFFGNILPKKTVTKEISINTERAPVGPYKVGYILNFTASFDKCEGEVTDFTVKPD
jgi:hypothetical protein